MRLCSLGAESYDTLGGRVEALEEKLKNGVPVQMVQAPQGGSTPPPVGNSGGWGSSSGGGSSGSGLQERLL